MNKKPLVSVIMPFYNTPILFMQEAVQSVLNQSYDSWELLLVDDGSQDESTELAQHYAITYSSKIRYLTHNSHQNRGASVSRQLALNAAQGSYIAFLDADDVWLPHKLEEQVATLVAQPEAAMLYGNTLYWYSWTGLAKDANRDYLPILGVSPNTLYHPPTLLPLYLEGKAAVPCTCSVLVKRDILVAVGGFEASFRAVYTDQVLYAKVCLAAPVYVAATCWDWYRQHPASSTGPENQIGQKREFRYQYLEWFGSYLRQIDNHHPPLWQALRREIWLLDMPGWMPRPERVWPYIRWAKKWLLRLGLTKTR